ncbi:hypothetical protein T190611E02C_10933 [Tenacibaculum sp. 190524A05c]|uniref:hypothetical protein n=1 Tax=Tenacibaculum platacis TaxID=3137852 RepID=UPI0031FAEE80
MKRNKEVLKEFFETGDKPTQSQYADLIDSLAHVDELVNVNTASLRGNGKPFTVEVEDWVKDHFGKMLFYEDSIGSELYYYDYGSSSWSLTNNIYSVNGRAGNVVIDGSNLYITNPKNKEKETLDKYLDYLFSKRVDNIDIEDGYLKLTTDTNPRKIVAQISLKALKLALERIV